jgi:DNA-binding response OmpR family regulator
MLVLVVDDDPDCARSLALLLRLWGHETLEAADGWAALALAQGDAPDVVLLDLDIPGPDGFEVARRLREQSGTLLWALTGSASEEDRQRALEAGCHRYLVKPVEVEELRALLAGSTLARGQAGTPTPRA